MSMKMDKAFFRNISVSSDASAFGFSLKISCISRDATYHDNSGFSLSY